MAEARLWARLRGGRLGGLKFRRQVPIGNAIVDFGPLTPQGERGRFDVIVEADGVESST
ncbi:MAG TPA: DUF559 domain-containing protein [Bauldia sp.]|nr:DUF559 domain-containing protein [Bauldia sp.]